MPQLLLELLTEEIPARMQAKAQADLERASAFGFRCGYGRASDPGVELTSKTNDIARRIAP